jgi:phage-related protein
MTEQNVDPKAKDQNLNENQASEKKWLWGLMKWFNKFTSKVQEKAKNIWNPVDKIVWGVKNIGNPVNKVIGGVTGFLDKIEEKIEEVSGVDLDSLATMPKKEEKKADEKVDEKADSDKEVKEETK